MTSRLAAVTKFKSFVHAQNDVFECMIDTFRQQTNERNLLNIFLQLYAVEEYVAEA